MAPSGTQHHARPGGSRLMKILRVIQNSEVRMQKSKTLRELTVSAFCILHSALLGLLLVAIGARTVFTQAGPAVLPSQFEFAGSWAPIGTEDVQNDSVPVDYLGLALTEDARTRALSYDESQKSMVERQCQGWGGACAVLRPVGLRISR